MPAPIDALFEILESEAITHIFGNPGTTELPLLDALADRDRPDYVLGLHEGSVVAMADGFARAACRPSFVNLHVAAGLANGLVGMLNARRSRTPMVVSVGQQDRRHLQADPMLAGDLVSLAAGACKHAVQVEHAYDLPLALRRAFALSRQPPAGPVVVAIPMDLLAEAAVVDVPPRTPTPQLPAAAGVSGATALLAGAHNPAIVAGDGVAREQAVAPLVRLAEQLGATVYHQPMADAVNFPGNHPLFAGMLTPTHAAVHESLTGHDLVLVVGAHAFSPHHYTPQPPIPPGSRVVQVDSDQAEIGRNFAVELGLVGGLEPTLAALVAELGEPAPGAAARSARISARLAAERRRRDAAAEAAYSAAPLDPLAAAHAFAAGLPPGAVVVEEAITTGIALRSVLRQDLPGSYVHTIGGALGWGIGAAIGTAIATPRRPTIAALGDGCALFGLQGLWTAAHRELPVTFVVFDNGEYRTLKNTLDAEAGAAAKSGRYVGLDLRPPAIDWAAAAATFGVPHARAGSALELRELVAASDGRRGPLLVEAPITGHEPPSAG
jgi:benzoylformate decarboxylase